MILVDFTEDDKGVRLRVSGHSSQADKGKDIVCAAVSALIQTFAGGVENELKAVLEGNLEAGNCDLRVNVTENRHQEMTAVYNVFKFGFRKIAESYPEQVKLN
ncbi:MAG: hypothetical protein CVV42_07950 [Candidatus Riflebacteria bacterium HGW-Riflebacteria-2]|jgi:hypothetical protein|nr:MAG: hypothetical protein CVV42_07950 [Candidatus Riflebacteria bacterium HGW-Riflebacteria-2]